MSQKKNFCVWKDTTDVIGLSYSYARCEASLNMWRHQTECAFFVPKLKWSDSCLFFAFDELPTCLCSAAISESQLMKKIEDI